MESATDLNFAVMVASNGDSNACDFYFEWLAQGAILFFPVSGWISKNLHGTKLWPLRMSEKARLPQNERACAWQHLQKIPLKRTAVFQPSSTGF